MAPFAGGAVGATHQVTLDHQAAAGAGADDDTEDVVIALAGTVHRLREGEAVGVVGQPDRTTEESFQIHIQRLTVETERIGVADQAAGRR